MRWTEAQLAAHLERTGVAGEPNTADTSAPPFAADNPSKWSVDREIPHTCKLCSSAFTSRFPRHLYCEPCSESQDLKRKRLDNRVTNVQRRKDSRRNNGAELSRQNAHSIADPPHLPALEWKVSIAIPFSWSGSKNAIWAMRRLGHVALRRESTAYRDVIIASLRSALRDTKILQNKLWIDIFVEKSNHRGDAVNFVDLVCDAVKVATALDDRWFSLRSVDWSIVKHEPNLLISIGQEAGENIQPCSYCGRLLAFDMFGKSSHSKHGISRICKDCSKKGGPKRALP